ncbi:hypothetical protein H5410_006073 [Solanum commersonii]|uniref:Uncharacterized protein n=1 Tax=Solanum commersonii TaxID=4109 RepID=A0A9J6AA68_SOLCO|nr:hypothetical protein H5410_006073 [Solanum commersonii]
MNAHNKTDFIQRSIVHSKIQVVTHHYRRISCSQYLLQVQVQAQPKCSNALTQRMIPYSHNGSQFKVSESNAALTLTKMSTMHNFTYRFAHIFQSTFASTHSRSQRSFKACNGAECKCMLTGPTGQILGVVMHGSQ